jgi:hypothetical protein
MSRPFLIELVLFLTPFALYAIFLLMTNKGVLEPASWPASRLAWLAICAFVLMIGSFIAFAHFGGSPPGSIYTPAELDEDGKLKPGDVK